MFRVVYVNYYSPSVKVHDLEPKYVSAAYIFRCVSYIGIFIFGLITNKDRGMSIGR